MKETLALEQDPSSEMDPSLVVPSSADAVPPDAVLADAVLADAVPPEAVLSGEASERAPASRAARAAALEVSSDEIAIGPYSDSADDEDDAVTLQMDTPLDDGEWMLQLSAYERRRLSTEQLSAEKASGALSSSTRVWRNGMRAWTPLGELDLAAELARKGGTKASSDNREGQELALSSTRPLVPPLAAPPKRTVPVLPSPPPPRLAPAPSRPGFGSARASSPGSALDVGLRSASSRALGPLAPAAASSSALGFGTTRALGLSPPPPRVEAPRVEVSRSEPVNAALPAFDSPSKASPAARRVDTATSVALDLGPVAPQRSRPWGALFAQGIAAVIALVGTSYALTRAGVFEPGSAIHAAARGQFPASARLALQPAPEMVAPAAGPSSAGTSAEGALAAPESEVAAPTAADPRQPASTLPAPASKELTGQTPAASEAAKPAGEMAAPHKDSAAVDPGSRRAKRARRVAALEAPRQRAVPQAAGEPARAEPERTEPASPPQEPGSTFDRQAAQSALATAAEQAKNCRPIGGPSGAGTVQVQYEPSGRVGAVTIVTPGFENSDAAACIQMLFRRARVPAFNGAKGAVLRQRFEIP